MHVVVHPVVTFKLSRGLEVVGRCTGWLLSIADAELCLLCCNVLLFSRWPVNPPYCEQMRNPGEIAQVVLSSTAHWLASGPAWSPVLAKAQRLECFVCHSLMHPSTL